jgi:YfiH family protein
MLPFEHGFTTRDGGVSEGPYASFNLGSKWGDDPARVRENRRRFFREAGIERLFSVTQVHGGDVTHVGPEAEPEELARHRADAIITNQLNAPLGIYTADCIAILIGDPKTGAIAAAHAGWRGTVENVATKAARALVTTFGSKWEDLRVAFGPSIGPCCFEVGEDVAAKFNPEFVKPRPGQKPTIDLRAANVAELVSAGVRKEHIDASPPCTACDRARFYSFRRDGRETGQHVAYIFRR